MNYYQELKRHKRDMTEQQYRLLKGQIKSGNGDAAMKGIRTIIERRTKENTNGGGCE